MFSVRVILRAVLVASFQVSGRGLQSGSLLWQLRKCIYKAGHQSSQTSFDEQDTVFNGCTNLALLKWMRDDWRTYSKTKRSFMKPFFYKKRFFQQMHNQREIKARDDVTRRLTNYCNDSNDELLINYPERLLVNVGKSLCFCTDSDNELQINQSTHILGQMIK